MPIPTLVVETGEGLANANSYVSYAELLNYSYRIPDAYKTAWNLLDETGISQLGIWATALLDQWTYYNGLSRLRPYQALNFPAIGLVDQFGDGIEHYPIPTFLKNATCQMAYELSKGDRTVEPTRGLESATVGPLSVVFDKNAANGARVIPRSVAVIIAPYGGYVRGSRSLRSVSVYRA